MIQPFFVLCLVEICLGVIILRDYTLPLLGLTLDTILSTTSFIDLIIGCVGVFLGPYLIFSGVIVGVMIIWYSLE